MVRAPKRKLVWARTLIGGSIASQAAPQDTQFVNLLGQFETAYGADMLGCTIMRIRGVVTWSSGEGVLETDMLIVGARIATAETSGVPTPSSLDDSKGPATSVHDDWMFYQPMRAAAVGGHENVIDVRSMRRLDELGQYLLVAFQFGRPSQAATFSAVFSTLIALP